MFAEKGFGKEFDILMHWLERSKLKRKLSNVKWSSNTDKRISFAFVQLLEE